MGFTHLHNHSNFSCYDGGAPLADLVEAAARLEMPALALTDHNTLAGAVRFYRAARAQGLRPIIGVEFEVEGVEEAGQSHRLLLLARDNAGYRSLCRLVTCAHLGEARSAGPFSPQYAQLDRKHPLLRQAHLQAEARGLVGLSVADKGEVACLLQAGEPERAGRVAAYYRDLLGADGFYLELQHHRLPAPANARRYRLREWARAQGLPVVATNDTHYVTPDYAPLQDVLYCLGQGLRVHEAHPGRKPNAEYYLKSPAQMAELFSDMPEALAAAEEIAERCRWELDLETIHLPRFDAASVPEFRGDPASPADRAGFLRHLCEQALPAKYAGSPLSTAAVRQLDHELTIINQHGLADYFLIVWDLVRFARERRLRCTGRGSAADSLVCYLLDLTQPEPLSTDLLFERFLNPERRDLPDIDLDFDARRRDEVVAYVYRKYGPQHVAAVATVNTFRAQAAVRELGKALGLTAGQISRVARSFTYMDLRRLPELLETLPEARACAEDLRHEETLLRLCGQVAGFPRHLAVHVGGLIISAGPLTDLVPLQLANKGIVVAQYDKDDVEALGLVKMDLLGLRIHTAIEHCLQLIGKREEASPSVSSSPCRGGTSVPPVCSPSPVGAELAPPGGGCGGGILPCRGGTSVPPVCGAVSLPLSSSPLSLLAGGGCRVCAAGGGSASCAQTCLDLERLPLDDPAVYELLRSTHTLGLFQLESPGQRNLQGRMQASHFEDIIASISLFRPGPVQADMITPFLARRTGREPVPRYHPELDRLLARTCGVIIYQEQVMRVAAAVGGFTLGQADRLRQAMNFDSDPGAMQELRESFLRGAAQRGISAEVAELAARQVAAFAAFGFNKAHAASFARLAYESAYLKAHYPAEFFAGLLSAQPMGFYPPRTLAEEAKRLGLVLRPPCVNRSEADYTVEHDGGRPAIRCGLDFLREMTAPALAQLLAARAHGGPFRDLRDFLGRVRVPLPVVENLILARAFAFTGQGLPALLGTLAALEGQRAATAPTLDWGEGGGLELGARVRLAEDPDPFRRLYLDLHLLGLSTELSPFAPWVEMTARLGVTPCDRLLEHPHGERVRVAGIVVARARPPTRSGRLAIFLCLEDHTGLVDISIFEQAYRRYGHLLYTSSVLLAEGEVVRRGERDTAVTVRRLEALPGPEVETAADCYAETGPGSYA